MTAIVILLALGTITPCGSRPEGRIAPTNFVFFGRDHEELADSAFLNDPGVAGAQVTFTWRELEPARDQYDFSAIREQLELLERHGKRIFVQLSDVTFNERVVVPQYLLSDTAFHGGAARKYEGAGTFDGWVARRWDPAVRARFARLIQAMASEFDGRLEGINLPETAIGFEDPTYYPAGFTPDAYATGILAILEDARSAFTRSCVVIYANFMAGESLPENDRGYLRSIYRRADEIGAGVGGPDILPHRQGHQANSLPLIAARAPGTTGAMAVQDGNLADMNPQSGKPVTVDEIYRYAADRLHLDYIFWGREEPYYSRDVLPYLRALAPGRQSRAGNPGRRD